MRKAILFFISVFCSLLLFSQATIKGRVVGAVSGLPIPGSSVYIAGTSKGTICDSEGQFELNHVPYGTNDLVISSIGYQTHTYSYNETQLPLQLKVELQVKVKELENVILEQSVEEGWDKWGKTFWDNFVGNTKNAQECKLLNQDVIHFRYFKNSKRLIAYADAPIVLENKALGYKVSYDLEVFEVDFNQNSATFLGYPLFIPIDGNLTKNRWVKAREEAYNGSILHFMRSLYHNRLIEEGFEVRRMARVFNIEKARVRAIIDQLNESQNKISTDSMKYYKAIMSQQDTRLQYSDSLLTADSLVAKNAEGIIQLRFDNYLFIVYKNQPVEQGYINFPLPVSGLAGVTVTTSKLPPQRSYVSLGGDKVISIAAAGNYFNPRDFFAYDYWAWGEKMANSLPFDYVR